MAWTEGAGVIFGGEGKVLVYSGTSTSLTADDLIGELVTVSGIGASKESKEFGGFHYKAKHKSTGQSTPNDISFTENLTSDGLSKRREQYKDGAKFYNAYALPDGTVLYACYGELSAWGMELTDGEACQLTYTMVLDDDDVTVTVESGSEG